MSAVGFGAAVMCAAVFVVREGAYLRLRTAVAEAATVGELTWLVLGFERLSWLLLGMVTVAAGMTVLAAVRRWRADMAATGVAWARWVVMSLALVGYVGYRMWQAWSATDGAGDLLVSGEVRPTVDLAEAAATGAVVATYPLLGAVGITLIAGWLFASWQLLIRSAGDRRDQR
jgi:hypothetical protein